LFYVQGPANVTDSFGNVGSRVSVNTTYGTYENFITIIGCTLSIIDQWAAVDSQTKMLLSANPVAVKTSSEWNNWPNAAGDQSFDPQIDGVSNPDDRGASSAVVNLQHPVDLLDSQHGSGIGTLQNL
jgi:hypothetical protein